MPSEIVARINAATRKAVNEPAVRKRIEDSGAVVVASTPEEYAADMRATFTELKGVVKDRKLSVD